MTTNAMTVEEEKSAAPAALPGFRAAAISR
jgi:hypothetical protein